MYNTCKKINWKTQAQVFKKSIDTNENSNWVKNLELLLLATLATQRVRLLSQPNGSFLVFTTFRIILQCEKQPK